MMLSPKLELSELVTGAGVTVLLSIIGVDVGSVTVGVDSVVVVGVEVGELSAGLVSDFGTSVVVVTGAVTTGLGASTTGVSAEVLVGVLWTTLAGLGVVL